MKRKDLHHDLSFIPFSPRKSPRLDVELLENMNEDPPIRVPQILEQGLLLQEQQQQQQPFTCSSNNMLQMAVAPLSMLSSNSLGERERALVLYNQPLNTPFFKSPCSPDFPIVLNSALIPGLKEHFLALGNGKLGNSMEKEDTDKNPMVSNDCVAVVPWVALASQLPLASGAKSPSAVVSEAMETEEVEMMDTDYDSGSNISSQRAFEYDGMVQEAGELPHWQQQHSMQPHFLKNNSAPVEW